MKGKVANSSIRTLLEAPDYRSFIRLWMNERSKIKKFGYADIARNGGFVARSFPRDVVKGAKRITLNSLPKLIRGMGLRNDLAAYFRLLVEAEHADCNVASLDTAKIAQMKEKLCQRILARSEHSIPSSDDAFQISSVPRIYAALGSTKRGATLRNVIDRTNLPLPQITLALEKMRAMGIATKQGQRYFPIEAHLSFEGLKQSDVFKKHFIDSCARAAQIANDNLKSDEKLFLSSAFSVNRADLPKLKEELRGVLLRFVDAAEQVDGEKVVNLVASLF